MESSQGRQAIIIGIFVLIPVIFLSKLFSIQVINSDYKKLAKNNVIREVTVYPSRGLIYDRNGKLMVYNEAAYDIMVTPGKVSKDLDLEALSNILEVEKEEIEKGLQKAKRYSRYKPSVLIKQISARTYANFQEHLHKYSGFYVRKRTVRRYPIEAGSNLLGYIGEVNDRQIKASNKYYQPGDYIGITGIENEYETFLRGKRGKKYLMVDVHGREQGVFEDDGEESKIPIGGKNITSTIDILLQEYGETLMQNKKGSIVAIEPSTGEILALVSSPSYDPNILSGRDKGDHYKALIQDTLIPLYNRPIMAQYSPGSVFKTVMGLIGLEEGVITQNSIYYSKGAYYTSGLRVGDHAPAGNYNVSRAIQLSSNAYFCYLLDKILNQKKYESVESAFEKWKTYLDQFGMGQKLGIDIPNEVKGLTPTTEYYNKVYGKGAWKAPTIISLSIGQGELLTTPLQIANMMAAFANRGYFKTPHLVKNIEDNDSILSQFRQTHSIDIQSKNFDIVIDAMEEVVERGTARIARLDSIKICGKTGTVENPHGADHSVFACFAPKENPQIAIAVIVENAGYGATWAAPIASFMIEKYLTNKITRRRKWLEDRVLNANLLNVAYEKE